MKKSTFIVLLILLFGGLASFSQPGSCLNFDGVNDKVLISDLAALQPSVGTVEAWIQTSNAGSGHRGVVVKEFGYSLFLLNNQLTVFNWQTSSSISSGPLLNDNAWHHIALTFQNNVANGSQLYIDGAAVGSAFTLGYTSYAGTLTIGSNGNNAQNFNGNIDEVRLWGKVLTPTEISNGYKCPLTGSEVGLIAYYNFNQGIENGANATSTILNDLAGTPDNGTLYNFTLSGTSSNWTGPGGVPSGVNVSIATQQSITCFGGNNGAASVNATGGSSLTYTWLPSGGNSLSASGLTAGTYTFNAKNSCNQTASLSVNIIQPSVVSVTTIASQTVICNGNGAIIQASASGGIGPYVYQWTHLPIPGISSLVTPTVSTTYSVNVTDANGCLKTQTIGITVLPLPILSSASSSSVICGPPFQQTVTLFAAGATTYTWLPSNVTGSTIAVTPSVTTTYTINGTNSQGCIGTTIITQSVSACTGVNGITGSTESLAKLYPNPFSSELIIDFPDLTNNILIYDLLGVEVRNIQRTDVKQTLNMEDLETGIYFIRIGSFTGKVIKSK